MKKTLFTVLFIAIFSGTSFAGQVLWEKQGNFYFLAKNSRDNFSAIGAGSNKFTNKYLSCDGVDFLARGADDWKDYGRLDLSANKMLSVPIHPGVKIDVLHLLAGGNFGNSYKRDALLSLYGDNYFYGYINVMFVYQDGVYRSLSVPIFWDWFHLGTREWAKAGAKIKGVGNNPLRKDCSMYHISFVNPRGSEPLKDILISDSWLSDIPFSDIFALTVESRDTFDAVPRQDRQFKLQAKKM